MFATACRSAARSVVTAVRPRVGSRRAGRNHLRSQSGNRSAGRSPSIPPVEVVTNPTERAQGLADLLPDFGTTAMTIVITRASDIRRGTATLVARLAELAVNDEVLVVCGANDHHSTDADVLATGLRRRLPRHDVVALNIAPHDGAPRRVATLVSEFMEIGSLPVLVTPTTAVRDIVAELSTHLRADRVLSLSCRATGTDLRQIWARRAVVTGQPA
jgi:hypothetical protein